MKKDAIPFQKQIFVCTNNREGASASCGDHQGEEVFRQLRQIAKDKGLHPQVRVAQAKCLGRCSMGVNVMIPEENVWYSGVNLDDVSKIAEDHIQL